MLLHCQNQNPTIGQKYITKWEKKYEVNQIKTVYKGQENILNGCVFPEKSSIIIENIFLKIFDFMKLRIILKKV